jgi:heptosyltransferase I
MTLSRFSPTTPPEKLCILRLSALGDISHTLPVLRTIQQHWPTTSITWVIGKTEHELVKDINGVEFITFDKSRGLSAYYELWRQLKGRRFDILLHMQVSIRASIASLFIPARIKLGFDKKRAKDLQWLFTNHKIKPASTRQHVVDSFLEFPKYFGLEPVMKWELPASAEASENLKHKLAGSQEFVVINPCALAKSRDWRDWTSEGYAAVADHIAEQLGMSVVLTGGPSVREKNVADAIFSLCNEKPMNLVGKTSIPELVAILNQARFVIAPDTGPAHISNALGTPVIGLYAATNPERAGPYRFQEYWVNKYPKALETYYQLSLGDAPWGKRIQNSEGMSMISQTDVIKMVDKVAAESKIAN